MATEGLLNKGVLKALMKMYAYCDMYEEACDLYECIRLEGLQPVGIMCGCLIMLTAECGQTDLSWQLAGQGQSSDIHVCAGGTCTWQAWTS